MPEWIRILSPQLLVDGVLTEPSENTFEARFDSCLSVVGDIPVFQFTAVSLMPDDTPWDDFICLVSPAIGDEDSPRPMTISCDADTLECETLASDWQGDAVGCLSVNRPGGPIIGYGGAGVWRCGTPVEIPTVKTSFGRIKARHR
jgi:hypothetical protein